MQPYKQMNNRVTESMKLFARRVDLYTYALAAFPLLVERDGSARLRLREHGSLIITQNKGYCHNATGETGNGIDFLMRYRGLSFVQAVQELCRFGGYKYGSTIAPRPYKPQVAPTPAPATPAKPFVLPPRETGSQARLYGYLCRTRGLSRDVVAHIAAQGILYQAQGTNNAVWVSLDKQHGEQVGTLSSRRFKGIVPGSAPDGYVLLDGRTEQERKTVPLAVYVCESAIDAMSFLQLHPRQVAASMGGLKPAAFSKVIKDYPDSQIVLAVDNDPAGDAFAARFPSHPRSRPTGKDWNDDVRGKGNHDHQADCRSGRC